MCVLRISGKEFDADRYLAVSGLQAHRVFHAGSPQSPSNPKGRCHEVSGFVVDVSERSWADLKGQVRDAIRFLDQNQKALLLLRDAPGVEDMRLDFPVDLQIDRRNLLVQFDYFPPELVSKAGAVGLGLELSTYPRDLEQLVRKRAKRVKKRHSAKTNKAKNAKRRRRKFL